MVTKPEQLERGMILTSLFLACLRTFTFPLSLPDSIEWHEFCSIFMDLRNDSGIGRVFPLSMQILQHPEFLRILFASACDVVVVQMYDLMKAFLLEGPNPLAERIQEQKVWVEEEVWHWVYVVVVEGQEYVVDLSGPQHGNFCIVQPYSHYIKSINLHRVEPPRDFGTLRQQYLNYIHSPTTNLRNTSDKRDQYKRFMERIQGDDFTTLLNDYLRGQDMSFRELVSLPWEDVEHHKDLILWYLAPCISANSRETSPGVFHYLSLR